MLRAVTFDARYGPKPAPSGSDFWQWDEVVAASPTVDHVWTVVEEAGLTYATAGYHIVNVVGYVVTDVPWSRGDEIARW